MLCSTTLLKQALAVDLEQSPFLNVLSDRKMGETLRLMGRQPNDRITREVAQEICLRTGSKALLAGSISRLGSHYMVGLQAGERGKRDKLGQETGQGSGKEERRETLGQLTSQPPNPPGAS